MEKLLADSLGSINGEFREDELAYLALTTKIEHPFRDCWAFSLQRILPASFIAAREWRRTDIAIIEEQSPRVLIELKAMYTFDVALDMEGISGFCEAMERDEVKAGSLAEPSTDIYPVLLATHPLSDVSRYYEGIIKYWQGINRALRLFSSSTAVADAAIEAVDKKLAAKTVVRSGTLKGGSSLGIEIEVL